MYVPGEHFCVHMGKPSLSRSITSRHVVHWVGSGPVQPPRQWLLQHSPFTHSAQLAGQSVNTPTYCSQEQWQQHLLDRKHHTIAMYWPNLYWDYNNKQLWIWGCLHASVKTYCRLLWNNFLLVCKNCGCQASDDGEDLVKGLLHLSENYRISTANIWRLVMINWG